MSKRAVTERLRLKAITLETVATSPLQAPLAAVIGSRAFESRRQWIKRGATNIDWIQLVVTGKRYFNVRDYGAVGNGVTDDRAAINLAIAAAIAAGGGVVFFPPGTYAVQRNGVAASLPISTNAKIVILGCGRSSRVLQSGSAGGGATGWYLFDITNGGSHVAFKNICLDGSAATNLGIGQDHHLIRVSGLTVEAGHVTCIDCYWNKVDGDGLRLLGSSGVGTTQTTQIQVIRGVFQMDVNGAGTGSRAAITVQRNCTFIGVHSSLLEGSTDQVLDMETSGTGTTGDISIDRCHLTHSAAASRTVVGCNGSATVIFRRLLLSNCIFDGGAIAFHEIRQLMIAQCMQTVSRFASVGGSLELDGVSDALIYGSQFYREDTDDSIGYSIQMIEGTLGGSDNSILGCICENASTPAGGQDGILAQSVTRIALADSLVYVAQLTNNVGTCFRSRSLAINANHNVCRRNLLIGTSAVVGAAAQVSSSSAGRTNQGAEVFGNIMRNILNGVGLSAVASSTITDVFGGNNAAVTTSQMFSTGAPAPTGIAISGNAGSKAIAVWEFTADPNTRIAAQIGAFGSNRVGGAGTTLYVKEADAGLTSGWDPK